MSDELFDDVDEIVRQVESDLNTAVEVGEHLSGDVMSLLAIAKAVQSLRPPTNQDQQYYAEVRATALRANGLVEGDLTLPIPVEDYWGLEGLSNSENDLIQYIRKEKLVVKKVTAYISNPENLHGLQSLVEFLKEEEPQS